MATTEQRPGLDAPDTHTRASQLVEAARRLGPLLREHVDRGEHERRLPDETAAALTAAGFFRLCRPLQLGGLEADPLTVIDVIEELARHDGSAAWCALNCGIAGVLQALLPVDGARDIGDGPAVILNGVIAPTGHAIDVGDAYVVSGRWAFVSNCHHCTWLAPTCVIAGGDPADPSTPHNLVMTWVRAADCRIIDTWDTAGMRATGSHDVEITDVFVPKHRTFPIPLPEPVIDSALFRFPVVGLWSAGIAAAALGIAKAAIDELLRLAGTKTPFGMASPLSTRPTAQLALCHAIATTRAARALLNEETARLWELTTAGTPITPAQQGHLRIAATHATAVAADAVDAMYTAAGSTSLYSASPLQRCLRDVHAITQHLFVATPTFEMLGKVLLGIDADGFML